MGRERGSDVVEEWSSTNPLQGHGPSVPKDPHSAIITLFIFCLRETQSSKDIEVIGTEQANAHLTKFSQASYIFSRQKWKYVCKCPPHFWVSFLEFILALSNKSIYKKSIVRLHFKHTVFSSMRVA